MTPNLTTRVNELEANLAQATENLGSLSKLSDDHRKGLERGSIERRTLVDRQDKFHVKLTRIQHDLHTVVSRIDALGEYVTQQQLDGIVNELKRLDQQTLAFNQDVNVQLEDIQDKLRFHADEIERVNTRVDVVEQDLSNATIDTEISVDKTNMVSWLIAAVVGVVVAIAVFLLTESFTDAETWETWRSVVAGILVGLAAFAFASSFEEFNVNLAARFRMPERDVDLQVPDEPSSHQADNPVVPDDHTQVFDQDELRRADEEINAARGQEVRA